MNEPQGLEGDLLQRVFAPLIGLPAWLVRKGYGSSLTMKFGNPHLEIRQPIIASSAASERVRRALRRRRVSPRGEWHLWIYCSHWQVISEHKEIARSDSSDQAIVDAAAQIDGQLLAKVAAHPAKGTSDFEFDDGAAIRTWPWDEGNDEQWMLHMPSGNVLTYRADGRYAQEPDRGPSAGPDREAG